MPQQTLYYKFADGSVAAHMIGWSGDVIVTPEAPEGGVEIPLELYELLVADLEDATAVLLGTLRGAEQQRALEDFTALRAVGIPALTAARLTGYSDDGDGPIHLPTLPGADGEDDDHGDPDGGVLP